MSAIWTDDSTTLEHVSQELDRNLRRNGSIIMSVFALVWAVGVPGFASAAVQFTVIVVALALTVATMALALRGNVRGPADGSRRMPSDWRRRYNRVGLIETIAILVAVFGLIWSGLQELIPATVCLIVGIHFFPLARIFNQALYRWVGIALCVAAALGVGALMVTNAASVRAIVGLCAAGILWITSVGLTFRG